VCIHSSEFDSLNTAFLQEPGIRFWENLNSPLQETDYFTTVTLIEEDCEVLVHSLRVLFNFLSEDFSKIIRWRTEGLPFHGNRIQVKRFNDTLSQPLPGFDKTFLDTSNPSSIACNASEIILPFSFHHFDALLQSNYTCLILSPDLSLTTEDVCTRFRQYDKGINREAIKSIIEDNAACLIARAYSDRNTCCVFQFIGLSENIKGLEKITRNMGFKEFKF